MSDASQSQAPERLFTVRTSVEQSISYFCQLQVQQASTLSPSYERLWLTMQDYFKGGGKRLRPYLVMLAYEAFGGTNQEAALHVATACELLHGAILMHDDIIDRDYMRHNQPNVAGYYQAHYIPMVGSEAADHYANSAGLIAGDLAISAAYHFIMTSSLTAEEKMFTAHLLHEAIYMVCGGELLDMEASMSPFGAIDPYVVAEQKTAGYSFVSPLVIGATLAGANKIQLDVLREYGKAVGIGFQLVDDMIGLFGDEVATGKSVLSDLREGKRTVVLDKTRSLVTDGERAEIEAALGNVDVTLAMLDRVRELATKSGAKAAVEQDIAHQKQIALTALESLTLSKLYRGEFNWVTRAALERVA